jgi:ATP-dependent helicase/nuclease subunit A
VTAPEVTLVDQAARDRIREALDETLFVEAGAGSGKTRSLVDRVVALVDAGVELCHIAAITFTEKAAAELRDRIRGALERRAGDPAADAEVRERFRTAVEQVDAAAISTLHAFAQRILSEHPVEAALPPNVEVFDEVASQIAFEDRWVRFRDTLLDDPALERCLLLAFAAGIRLDDLRGIALAFQDNWDLADTRRVPWGEAEPPRVDVAPLLAQIDALVGRTRECGDGGDLLCTYLTDDIAAHAERLRQAPDELEALRLLREPKPTFKARGGR